MTTLLEWLWQWIDGACTAVLVASTPAGGRLTAAERRELRHWLDMTWEAPEDRPEQARSPSTRAGDRRHA